MKFSCAAALLSEFHLRHGKTNYVAAKVFAEPFSKGGARIFSKIRKCGV